MTTNTPEGSDSRPSENDEQTRPTAVSRSRQFFSIPPSIKRIFDRFPLVTYPPNDLPAGTTRIRDRNRLYVFIDVGGAESGKPSFNPQCLKWQAYLNFVGIDFDLISSNNHASPTGALPFLLPALPANPSSPIPSNKLQKWAIEQVHCEEEQQISLKFDVYASLLDHRIRHAWLYQLYLHDDNFANVARRLYIDPSTSSSLVRTALATQLQQAARHELLKSSNYIDVLDLETDAENAFDALSTLLSNDEFFFDRTGPGLFDASVFAYTHLLLDGSMGWRYNRLGQLLRRHANLVSHRDRLLDRYF